MASSAIFRITKTLEMTDISGCRKIEALVRLGVSDVGFVPRCEPSGRQYAPLQCAAPKERTGTGQCWCATIHGQEIPASRHADYELRDCEQLRVQLNY